MPNKAKHYHVYHSMNGYDINLLVKATSKKQAGELAMKESDLDIRITPLSDEEVAQEFAELDTYPNMKDDLKKFKRKRIGAMRTGEGT